MNTPFALLLRIDRAAERHTLHPRHLHPALDLKYIQAGIAQQTGQTPPLLDGWLAPFDASDFAAKALALRPRVAVIRAVTWCIEESIAVARALRREGIITIAVGQQVQHAARLQPPGWLEAFDLAVNGEPEIIVPQLVARLQGGASLAALQVEWPNNGNGPLAMVTAPETLPQQHVTLDELAAYPFPFPLRGRPLSHWGYVLTAWGCPRPCKHCSTIVRRSVGRPLRTRPVPQVLDEVARLAELGAEAIAFEDDSLFVHKSRFLDIANGLVQRGLVLPWLANARPDELDDECVAAARASGARLLKVGVETGSARLIEEMGKAADGERWHADSLAAFARLDAAGIGAVALLLVGLPGESAADLEATQTLAATIRADYLQIQRYQPYPDVDDWAAGGEPSLAADYHYASASNEFATRALQHQRQMYRNFYLRPAFIARHLQHSWQHYLLSRETWSRGVPLLALRFLLGKT